MFFVHMQVTRVSYSTRSAFRPDYVITTDLYLYIVFEIRITVSKIQIQSV